MLTELVVASLIVVQPSGMPTSDWEAIQAIQNEEEVVYSEVAEYMTPGAIIEEPYGVYEVEEPAVNGPMLEHLTKSGGVFYGPSGKETYYNLNMSRCIDIMRGLGYDYEYWIRDDGVKMFGDYVMIAANTGVYPKGSIIETSLGTAIVVDHCPSGNIDVCVSW